MSANTEAAPVERGRAPSSLLQAAVLRQADAGGSGPFWLSLAAAATPKARLPANSAANIRAEF
jgi:hypothetical protein